MTETEQFDAPDKNAIAYDLVEYAIAIINNVDFGNWSKQSKDWQNRARIWNDLYEVWVDSFDV